MKVQAKIRMVHCLSQSREKKLQRNLFAVTAIHQKSQPKKNSLTAKRSGKSQHQKRKKDDGGGENTWLAKILHGDGGDRGDLNPDYTFPLRLFLLLRHS